ncbi:ras-related protein Rab-24 [Anabrus simplex]|uniref:ras-related protein Rab-24 n=1 Tax=Anabrus simplex TaxID=316456 RepID=UPI0034DD2F6E
MSRVDLKIVLLGSEYVGKTSLLERYVYDRFRGCVPYQNTIGAAFAAKQVESKGKAFVIGIWDTAGSERYEAMSRIYYRGAKAAIVCYDIGSRPSWDRAKFWISELRGYEETCKIYLVGTKLDTIQENNASRQIDLQHVQRYSDGIQARYIETSSKTGENVAELFQMIADDYMECPENAKQVEETISLNAKEKRSSCCVGAL